MEEELKNHPIGKIPTQHRHHINMHIRKTQLGGDTPTYLACTWQSGVLRTESSLEGEAGGRFKRQEGGIL